jgi:tetratricopeptide (TPR) repeat protein
MANKAEFKQDISRTVNLNYLAQLHCSQNEFEQAEKLYKEVLEIHSNNTNENDPELILPLHQLGLVSKAAQELASLAQTFYGMNQYAEAESLFRYALIIGEENFWPEHPFVIEAFQKVGEWHLAHGSASGAVDFLEQAAVRSERLHGPDSPRLVNVYEKYLEALEKNNNPKADAIKVKLINVRPVAK